MAAANPASLTALAAQISEQVKTLTQLLKTHNLPEPTLGESGAEEAGQPTGLSSSDDAALIKIRNELINGATDLLHLAMGPTEMITNLAYGATDTANLSIITRFDIASKIPAGATVSATDLATKTGLSEDHLLRVVRYAITLGLFVEPKAGHFGHSAASATLAKNSSVYNMTLFNSGFSTRIVTGLSEALKAQHDGTPDAPEAAFNVAYPGYSNLFEYMGQHPQASREYFSYLDGRSQLSRYQTGHVVKSWDWKSVGNGTIVDVGGSSGFLGMDLARSLPNARVVVQDINAEGLEMGREIASKEATIASRVDFQQHDFFKPQSAQADVFIYRHILHDWPDSECVKIIQALEPAMRDGTLVMLSEGVVPEPPAVKTNLLDERHVRIDDHVMMAAHNAKERSVEQYTKLFQAASPKFSLVGAFGKQYGVHHTLVIYKYSS